MTWEDETVLIAGGAGTIGSNLAKTIASECKSLVIIDYDENTIEQIRCELEENSHECTAYLCDIRNSRHLMKTCLQHKPTIIVNCAAHKHLNASEMNISECVFNNLEITRNLLSVVVLSEAKDYIHISTDKAVLPTSVMGASKMLCECMVRDFFSIKHFVDNFDPDYHILRFGNVLGSQGSVWKVWERQFEQDMPLTVTDLNMERYILEVGEACEFIKFSHTLERGTYLLDMPRKMTVKDLLEKFQEEVGTANYPIKVIGSKPGEKQFETLSYPQEEVQAADHIGGKIVRRLTNSPYFPYSYMHWIAKDYDDAQTLKALKRIFPKVRA